VNSRSFYGRGTASGGRLIERAQAAPGRRFAVVADTLTRDAEHHRTAIKRDIFQLAPAGNAQQSAYGHGSTHVSIPGRVPTTLLTKPG
jgi:hypothetical protein